MICKLKQTGAIAGALGAFYINYVICKCIGVFYDAIKEKLFYINYVICKYMGRWKKKKRYQKVLY